MRILHLRTHENVLKADMPGVSGTPGLLLAIPLRLSESPLSMSLLFEDGASLSIFREHFHRSTRIHHYAAKEFDVPPEDTIRNPIIILGAPRSGTTLLFELLAQSPDLWTINGESHEIIEGRGEILEERGNRREAQDAAGNTAQVIRAGFVSVLRNRNGCLYLEQDAHDREKHVRLLEKTPKNCLRVPFLRAIFPDCKFGFLYREPLSNIASLIDGWATRHRFNSYRLEDIQWKFLLPPGWGRLTKKSIPEIAAAQWHAANHYILNDLASIPREQWLLVDYHDLVAHPAIAVMKICEFAFLRTDNPFRKYIGQSLPLSGSTLTPPSPDKWRRHAAALSRLMPRVQDIVERVSQIRNTG